MKRWLAGGGIVLACLATNLLLGGCTGSDVIIPPEGKPIFAALPEFDPPGGVYAAAQDVTIACTTSGAKIYYSTDGTDPSDTAGTLYLVPVHVGQSMTLKAAAYSDTSLPSIVAVAAYTIGGNVPPAVTDATVTAAVQLRPGEVCSVSIACTAKDSDGYVASVTADLTDLGGSKAQALTKGAGDQWTWSGNVKPASGGRKQVSIAARDDQGSLGSATAFIEATVPVGGEKWRFSTQGPILSSVAIATDGTLYFGSSDRYLYAVNPDGSQKWTCWMGASVSGTPAVAGDGTIYIGASNTLIAVNPDGSRKWATLTSGSIYSSVAIGVGGMVCVGTTDGTLMAVNRDGSIRWTYPIGSSIESSPAIDSQGTIYVGAMDGNVYAIAPTGQPKWAAPFATGGSILASPAIGADDTIYIGSTDGSVYAINSDGTKKWTSVRGGGVNSSPALSAAGTLYVGSDNAKLTAIDAASGAVKWEFLAVSGVVSSPTIAADGTIYFASVDGTIYALGADSRELWRYSVNSRVVTSAALGSDGTIYLGATDRRLYAIAGTAAMDSGPWPTQRGNMQRTGAVAAIATTNFAPILSAASVSGRLVQGQAGTLSVSCTAMDFETSVASVVVDLSPLGASASQAMTKGAGDTWSWTGSIAATGFGKKTLQITAKDTVGASTKSSVSTTVLAPPSISAPSFVVNGAATTDLGTLQPVTVTISCKASDPDKNALTKVQVDLTQICTLGMQDLADADGDGIWTWTGLITPSGYGSKNLFFHAVDGDGLTADVTLSMTVENAQSTLSNPSISGALEEGIPSVVTISVKVSDLDGITSVTADLSKIPPGFGLVNLTGPDINGIWTWSSVTPITPSTPGTYPVVLVATDGSVPAGTTTKSDWSIVVGKLPEILDWSVTPAPVVANQATTVVVSCNARDADVGDAVKSAVVDLSWLGGSPALSLDQGPGDTWSKTVTLTPPDLGDMFVTLKITDMRGGIVQQQKKLTISQIAPKISNLNVQGILRAGKFGNLSIMCQVTDAVPVSSVVADLSALGGPNPANFDQAGNVWSWSGAVMPPDAIAKTVTITATGSDALVSTANVIVSVSPWTPRLLNGLVESSPAISNGVIYLGSADYKLYAVNAVDGTSWTVSLNGDVQSSPAIGPDGTIYVGSGDQKLYAVSPATKSVLWTYATGGRVYSSPAVATVAVGGVPTTMVYVGSDDGKLYAVNPADRTKSRSLTLGGKVASSPAVGPDGSVYVGTTGGASDKKLHAVLLSADGSALADKWTPASLPVLGMIASSAAIGPAVGTPAVRTIYVTAFGSGTTPASLYAIKETDGSKLWSFPLGATSVYSSPAVDADGTIYVGAESDGGKLYAIDSAGAKKWECLMDGLVRSSPTIASNGTVFVGTNSGTLYAVNTADGSVKWTFHTGAEVRSSPVLAADGTLYVGSYDNYLYAISGAGSLTGSSWPMFRAGPLHTGLPN